MGIVACTSAGTEPDGTGDAGQDPAVDVTAPPEIVDAGRTISFQNWSAAPLCPLEGASVCVPDPAVKSGDCEFTGGGGRDVVLVTFAGEEALCLDYVTSEACAGTSGWTSEDGRYATAAVFRVCGGACDRIRAGDEALVEVVSRCIEQ